jgi:hypothetical protein
VTRCVAWGAVSRLFVEQLFALGVEATHVEGGRDSLIRGSRPPYNPKVVKCRSLGGRDPLMTPCVSWGAVAPLFVEKLFAEWRRPTYKPRGSQLPYKGVTTRIQPKSGQMAFVRGSRPLNDSLCGMGGSRSSFRGGAVRARSGIVWHVGLSPHWRQH